MDHTKSLPVVRHLLTTAFAAAALAAAAQTTTTYDDLGEFTGLRAGSAFEVDVVLGDAYAVEVTAPDKIADRLEVEVRGGVLVLRVARGRSINMRGKDELRASVTMPRLESVDASGAASIHSEARWAGDEFAVDASGAAEVDLELEVASCSVSASGASDVELSGTAETLVADASGASDVDASELRAATVTVSSSGASDVDVYASRSLAANASGGSDIRYAGEASDVSVDASGGSDIRGPKR